MRSYINIAESFNFIHSDTNGFMIDLHHIMETDAVFWSSVYLHILPDRYDIGEVYISDMGVLNHDDNAGKRKGSHMLQTIISLADKHHVRLKLVASEDSPSSDFLEEWYSRYGFYYNDDYSDYGPVMIRDPL